MTICRECRLFIQECFIILMLIYCAFMGYNIPLAVSFVLMIVPVMASIDYKYLLYEIVSIFCPIFILSFFNDNYYASIFSTSSYLLLILTVRTGKKWTAFICYILAAFLTLLSITHVDNISDVILIAFALITLIINSRLLYYRHKNSDNIAVIQNSDEFKIAYGLFSDEALKEKNVVYVSSYEDNIINSSDIVIGFRRQFFVSDLKFFKQVIKELPKGSGKNAFIIYDGKCYPDMVYIALWLILFLKGWDISGRAYTQGAYDKFITECGGDFSVGFMCGFPIFFLPSPLILLSLIGLNRKK